MAQDPESLLAKNAFLAYECGTINTENLLRFTRMIFRVTRGNVYQS